LDGFFFLGETLFDLETTEYVVLFHIRCFWSIIVIYGCHSEWSCHQSEWIVSQRKTVIGHNQKWMFSLWKRMSSLWKWG